ncbi:MAG TPA: FxsA family protein [Acidimicrobiia bacterium]|nr:FxsA family protein [Acidimicrobiia bacterium]
MLPLLVLAFLVLPIAELAFIIYVGTNIGVLETIGLLLAVSVVGAWLAKREGIGVWRAVNRRVAAGEVPGSELLDAFLILFAGALLLTPGFLTDIVAVALLLPPVRAGVRRVLRRRFEQRVEVRAFEAGRGWVDGRSRPADRDEVDRDEASRDQPGRDAIPPGEESDR